MYTVHPKVHAPATVPLRSSQCGVDQTAVLWGTSQNYYHGRPVPVLRAGARAFQGSRGSSRDTSGFLTRRSGQATRPGPFHVAAGPLVTLCVSANSSSGSCRRPAGGWASHRRRHFCAVQISGSWNVDSTNALRQGRGRGRAGGVSLG